MRPLDGPRRVCFGPAGRCSTLPVLLPQARAYGCRDPAQCRVAAGQGGPLLSCRDLQSGEHVWMTPSLRATVRTAVAAPLLVLAVAALAAPRPAHAGPVDDVCAPMQAYAESSGARVGFVVLDLTDGSRCANRADEVFRTASLYKLIVLAEAHEQARQGGFAFDESLTIRAYRPATETRPEGVDVFELDALEAARRMIQVSDNNTAEALAKRLTWAAVHAAPARLGLTDTILAGEYVTTADDIAHFFARLHYHQLLGPDEDEAMLEMLRGQLVRDRIPWFLPGDVEIAHKTGRLYEYANDAGIVYAPAGPFVLVLLTASDDTLGPGYEAIRNLARMAYEAFAEERPAPTPTPPPTPEPTPEATATPAPSPTPTATPVVTATPAPTPTSTPATHSSERSARTGVWEPSPEVAAGVAALAGIVVTFGLIAGWLGRRREPPEAPGG